MLRAALYSENFLSTYNLDYESIKLVTANIPMRNGRARAVLWRRRIGQSSGVSGGDVHSQIWVFWAQCIPVPYNTSTNINVSPVMVFNLSLLVPNFHRRSIAMLCDHCTDRSKGQ